MHFLTEDIWFPAVDEASFEGLLAIGGDLSVDRLKLAYSSGIFPWYGDAEPIMWWSPNPRMVLFPGELYVSRNLQKKIDKEHFRLSFNTNFEQVIHHCANVKREAQGGTWITDDMLNAYIEFHKQGWAQSVEVWNNGKLVGGLYGVNLRDQKVFCGESMFSLESDASKVGLHYLVELLNRRKYRLIDCQMYTEHLERMGAREIPRDDFLKYLTQV